MASAKRDRLPMALIAFAAAASVWAWANLPPVVGASWSSILPIDTPVEYAKRDLIVWPLPILTLVIWLCLRAATGPRAQWIGRRMFPSAPSEVASPEQFARFDGTYDVIVAGIVGL